MTKKAAKKEEELVIPKGQLLRLKKLFSIHSGKENVVNPRRLN